MIGAVVAHLRAVLDTALRTGLAGAGPGDLVVLPAATAADAEPFASGAVTLLVVNVEENRLLRPPDPYERRSEGAVLHIRPDVRLDVQVLLVARFPQYDQSWTALSVLLRYLQAHPVLDRTTAPDLPEGVDRLVFALRTLSLTEQGELWTALRLAYQPCLAYRITLLTFVDGEPVPARLVAERSLDLTQLPGRT